MDRASNPVSVKRIFSFPQRPIHRLRGAVNHTSPPSAEVKNEWRFTSTPPAHRIALWHGERNFILFSSFFSRMLLPDIQHAWV